MIQPNTNKAADLFLTSNSRAGLGFATGQLNAGSDRAINFGGFKSKLTTASSLGTDNSRHRPEFTTKKDSKRPLFDANRADALNKPKRRDAPLPIEPKRAVDGKLLKADQSHSSADIANAGRGSHALLRSAIVEENDPEGNSGNHGTKRNDASRPTQIGDIDSNLKSKLAKSQSKHDADGINQGKVRADVDAAQPSGVAGVRAADFEGLGKNPETTFDPNAAPGHTSDSASGTKTANAYSVVDSERKPESNSEAGFHAESSNASGTPAKAQSGKIASGPNAAKALPPITINRLNQQLLTADPRQMLLGLDTLSSRMVMSAAQIMTGDGPGTLASNPTAAAKIEATAQEQPASSPPSNSSPRVGGGHPSSFTDHHNNSHIENDAGKPAAASADANDAHIVDPERSAGSSPRLNTNDAAFAGTEDRAIEGVRGTCRNTSSEASTPSFASSAVSAVSAKQAGKESIEQTATARADRVKEAGASNGQTDEAQAESVSTQAGNGGQAGHSNNQFGQGTGGESANKATGNNDQPLSGEQQQASRALAQQVERAVASASRQAERLGGASGPVTLRLKPESLGQVRIRLSGNESGRGIAVKIEVGSTDAQRLLSESLGLLRDALKAKGLVLEQSAVGVDPLLASESLREGGQSRENLKQAEAFRTNATRAWPHDQYGQNGQNGQHTQPHVGDALRQSGGEGHASDDRRGRPDPRSFRGGFFDGALLVAGNQRSSGDATR